MECNRFFVIADTHYFASSIGAYGEEYEKRMRYEQKTHAETQAINEAVFEYLESVKDIDVVLIAGDLTYNGEKESHKGFTRLLKRLKESGKRIYIITAGHDYRPHPYGFNENGRFDVEGIKRGDLFDYYYEFGFKNALAVDREHLSYCAQLFPGVRLLALNNDDDGTGKPTYSGEQIEWIREQAIKGREDGQFMIAMNHYPLLPGKPVFALTPDAVMKNADAVTTMLADEGVHLCFTGHMHNQSINEKITEKGNKFYDVCTGSITGCPAKIRIVTIKDEKTVKIESMPVPDFEWDMGGKTTEKYFADQFDMMINSTIEDMAGNPDRLLRDFGASGNRILQAVFSRLGKIVSTSTIGSFSKKLLVKADPAISERKLQDLVAEVVRNMFEGDQPYIEGTPEYELFMKVLGRFRPIIKILNKKLPSVNGKPADLFEIVKHTIGNYGIPDNEAELILK